MTLESELQAACAATRGLFGAAACSCALARDDGAELEFIAADGAGAENIVGVRLPISRGIAGFVALSGQPMAIADVASDERFARDVAEATEYVPTSILAAPLLDEDGETIGVLEVLDAQHPDDEARMGAQRGTVAELAALTVVAASLASVVRLSRLLEATEVPADTEAPCRAVAAHRRRPGGCPAGPRGDGGAGVVRPRPTVSLPAWSEAFEELAEVTALPLPDARRDWAFGDATGKGVKVAIVDSGIDGEHPAVGEIAGYVAVEADPDSETGTRFVDGPHEDLVGHGTACAGIIRAIAPDAEIYSVRVLGPNLKGKGLLFLSGIEWAVEAGMDVVNMSLSSKSDAMFAPLHEVADEAFFGGSVLVCAANNVPGPTYPSQFASVISVAARDTDDPLSLAYNPRPPGGVRGPRCRRRGRLDRRRVDRGDGQQLRDPACRRHGGADPVPASGPDAVPGQGGAARDQRERGLKHRTPGPIQVMRSVRMSLCAAGAAQPFGTLDMWPSVSSSSPSMRGARVWPSTSSSAPSMRGARVWPSTSSSAPSMRGPACGLRRPRRPPGPRVAFDVLVGAIGTRSAAVTLDVSLGLQVPLVVHNFLPSGARWPSPTTIDPGPERECWDGDTWRVHVPTRYPDSASRRRAQSRISICRAISGSSSSSCWKARWGTASVARSVVAVTVADLGRPSIMLISPK